VDCVIITYRNKNKDANAFGIALEHLDRLDVGRRFGDPRLHKSGWEGSFTREVISLSTPVEIEGWGFDLDNDRLCKLTGRLPLD
jgi:hypothetical protein